MFNDKKSESTVQKIFTFSKSEGNIEEAVEGKLCHKMETSR